MSQRTADNLRAAALANRERQEHKLRNEESDWTGSHKHGIWLDKTTVIHAPGNIKIRWRFLVIQHFRPVSFRIKAALKQLDCY